MAHYDIKALKDSSENTITETLPREGLVHEVCREWLLHEDQALAYRLQSEEYQSHLGHNRQRNAILRKDTPRAKEEQLREDEEAARIQMQLEMELSEQERRDAAIAAAIGADLDREEQERERAQQIKDQQLAKKLVEEEKSKIRQIKEIRQVEREAAYLGINSGLDNVAILSRKDKRSEDIKEECRRTNYAVKPRISRRGMKRTNQSGSEDLSDLSDFCLKPSSSMDEEEMRHLQESQDEELARLLQEQDLKRRGDLLQEDQLLAIEAQDKELAKVLQEQERAKAKKAREKARQKALLKQHQRQGSPSAEESPVPRPQNSPKKISEVSADHHYASITPRSPNSSHYDAPMAIKGAGVEAAHSRTRNGDGPSVVEDAATEDVERASPSERKLPSPFSSPPTAFPNIACAIDPTYQRRVKRGELSPPSTLTSPSYTSPKPSASSATPLETVSSPEVYEEEEEDDYLPPPYMPIQGQRRTASLEKRKGGSNKTPKEKGEKGGCKQQ